MRHADAEAGVEELAGEGEEAGLVPCALSTMVEKLKTKGMAAVDCGLPRWKGCLTSNGCRKQTAFLSTSTPSSLMMVEEMRMSVKLSEEVSIARSRWGRGRACRILLRVVARRGRAAGSPSLGRVTNLYDVEDSEDAGDTGSTRCYRIT